MIEREKRERARVCVWGWGVVRESSPPFVVFFHLARVRFPPIKRVPCSASVSLSDALFSTHAKIKIHFSSFCLCLSSYSASHTGRHHSHYPFRKTSRDRQQGERQRARGRESERGRERERERAKERRLCSNIAI